MRWLDFAWILDFAWVRRLGLHGSRRRQLTQLQLELTKVSQSLDEIEKRPHHGSAAVTGVIDETSNPLFENAETRFAACVASGMSKIRSASNAS
jgi:hypothetical protein